MLGERTSAYHGAITVLDNLFINFNDRFTLEWWEDEWRLFMQLFINNNNIRIKIQADSTKRHKWDGVISTTDRPKATVVLIEFAGGFGQGKDKEVLWVNIGTKPLGSTSLPPPKESFLIWSASSISNQFWIISKVWTSHCIWLAHI